MDNYKTDLLDIRRMDCMDLMSSLPDKHFALAIVDPPYGIGRDRTLSASDDVNQYGTKFRKKEYAKKAWDKNPPTRAYFKELRRVSKHQIIWGANYFSGIIGVVLRNFIYWHKKGKSGDEKYNEGELAFVSFGRSRMVDIWWNGVGVVHSGEFRFHPTQKPVALYRWLLANYAKPGDNILDTHMGSGSIAIACHYAGYHLTATELDQDYFDAAVKRIERETSQLTLSI